MDKQLILENRIDEITRLGEFVEQIADELELDPTLAFNINLALEEAVTNVICYAFPSDETHTFQVTAVGENPGTLTLQIIDTGIAFNPLESAPEVDITLEAEDRPVGGLGIFLVQQLMDDVNYERQDGQNILTLHKTLKP